jgi:hypothetical protein
LMLLLFSFLLKHNFPCRGTTGFEPKTFYLRFQNFPEWAIPESHDPYHGFNRFLWEYLLQKLTLISYFGNKFTLQHVFKKIYCWLFKIKNPSVKTKKLELN